MRDAVRDRDHAIKAHERAKGPKRLITIPGIMHYGIYTVPEARQRSLKLAIEWFDQYLKGVPSRQPTAVR